jgi:hypothetical protein
MTATGTERLVRWVGITLGIAVATLLVAGWRLPPGSGALGADVTVTLASGGELDASPTGRVLAVAGLRAAPNARTGSVDLRNLTGSTLDISARALPSTKALDNVLDVTLVAGDRRIYSGRLSGLRDWSDHAFAVRRGERLRFSVAVGIPEGTDAGAYRGRIEDITIELRPVARRAK